jgi:hypothetical protein
VTAAIERQRASPQAEAVEPLARAANA